MSVSQEQVSKQDEKLQRCDSQKIRGNHQSD